MNVRNEALNYARKGFSVIPIGKDKKPAIEWKKYQSEKASEKQIEEWFKESSELNIGIVTGEISGIVAVDVEAGGNTKDLPPTVISKTGGGGWHFLYKHPGREIKNAVRIREKTDIRGDRGYIVVPPSLHTSGKRYEWLVSPFEAEFAELPAWIIEKLANSNENKTDWQALLNKEVLEGSRNSTAAQIAGKILHHMPIDFWEISGWATMKEWNNNQNKPPLPETELRSTWESIREKELENKRSKEEKNQSAKKIKKEGEDKHRFIASEILNDGTIIEMLFNSTEGETSLAMYKDGEIKKVNSFNYKGIDLKPHSAEKDLLKSKVILFPSEPIEYRSQKELIRDIQVFIHKYLSISLFFEKIASYYVLFSWIHDDFNELPYLRGLGDYGTGKSRFLQVVGSICYRPIFASGATTVSPIFRILNDFKGTLILDEADFKFSETTAEIIKILNSGFMKGMPVLRCEGNNKKNFDVKAFSVFGPKIIATRQLYKDTALESRMITEDMNLNFTRKDISYNIPDLFYSEALEIRNKLLMFRFRNKGKSKLKPELENREIEPRLNQIAIPLMSIVDDQDIIKEIQQYIKDYNEKIKVDRTLGYSYQILDAICELLDDNWIRPTVQQVADVFNKNLSYSEIITPKKMGYLIRKTLDIKTERTRDGYVISEDNKKKIEILRKRYGIKKECEDVNIVNIESEEKKGEINVETLFN
jgi:hypothetical protein